MSKKTKDMSIIVNKDCLRDKDYDTTLLGWSHFHSKYDEGKSEWVFNKNDIRKSATTEIERSEQRAAMSAYKFRKALKKLEERGVVQSTEKPSEFIVRGTTKEDLYVKLTPRTCYWCCTNLNNLSMKIYLYLMGKHEQHIKNYADGPYYRFSKKELLEMAGYQYETKNLLMVDDALEILTKIGVLDISNRKVKSRKNGGYYYELWGVKQKDDTDDFQQWLSFKNLYEGLGLTKNQISGLETKVRRTVKETDYNKWHNSSNEYDEMYDPRVCHIMRSLSKKRFNEFSNELSSGDEISQVDIELANMLSKGLKNLS